MHGDNGSECEPVWRSFLRGLGFGTKPTTRAILYRIEKKVKRLMATQTEATLQLEGALAKLTKVGNETRTLLTLVQTLRDQIGTIGEVTPALQAAIDNVDAQVTVVDDLVPDEVTPPVEPPTT